MYTYFIEFLFQEGKSETKEPEKRKRKIRLDMHLDQVFIDGPEAYVWIYDPIPLYYWLFGALLVLAAIGICMFPLWPPGVRYIFFYISIFAIYIQLVLAYFFIQLVFIYVSTLTTVTLTWVNLLRIDANNANLHIILQYEYHRNLK